MGHRPTGQKKSGRRKWAKRASYSLLVCLLLKLFIKEWLTCHGTPSCLHCALMRALKDLMESLP